MHTQKPTKNQLLSNRLAIYCDAPVYKACSYVAEELLYDEKKQPSGQLIFDDSVKILWAIRQYIESLILGITNICNLLRVGTINQWHCAAEGEQWQQWQQWRQQRSGTMIPLAQQGCVTGVVVVIIIVLVTALAYVAEAVPGHGWW